MNDQPSYIRERRRDPRIALSWPVAVSIEGSGPVGRGTTVNVSPGGLCLRAPEPVEPAAAAPDGQTSPRFLLRLTLPGDEVLADIEAVRVWQRSEQGQVRSGWQFLHLERGLGNRLLSQVGLYPAGPEGYDRWDEDEIELWDYVKVLIKRRWLIIWCTCLAALAGLAYVSTEPDTYTATAQIFSVGQVDYLSLKEDLGSGKTAPYLAVLESLRLNRRVLNRDYAIAFAEGDTVTRSLVEWSVVRAFEWQRDQAREALADTLDSAVRTRREAGALGWLRSMAEFEQSKDGILTITIIADFPDLAAQIANAYVSELETYQLETSTGHTDQNLGVAEARMATLEKELNLAERALEDFRESNQNLLKDAVDINLRHPDVMTKLDRLERELNLKKTLYMTVANQYELLRLKREEDATGIEVVDRAEAPLKPDTRSRKYIIISGLLGAFLGVFLAFVLEYLENKNKAGQLAPVAEAWREDRDRVRRWLRLGR